FTHHATPAASTLSLHDALPISSMFVALTVTPALGLILLSKAPLRGREPPLRRWLQAGYTSILRRIIRRPSAAYISVATVVLVGLDRKSTRLNSSHVSISYAVFC